MDADLVKMSSDHILSKFTNMVDNWLSWAQKKKVSSNIGQFSSASCPFATFSNPPEQQLAECTTAFSPPLNLSRLSRGKKECAAGKQRFLPTFASCLVAGVSATSV